VLTTEWRHQFDVGISAPASGSLDGPPLPLEDSSVSRAGCLEWRLYKKAKVLVIYIKPVLLFSFHNEGGLIHAQNCYG